MSTGTRQERFASLRDGLRPPLTEPVRQAYGIRSNGNYRPNYANDLQPALLLEDGEYVYGRLEGGGNHTGRAFLDYLVGFFPAHSGQRMDLAATITLRIKNGKIAEDITRVTWAVEPPRLQKSAA